MVADAALGASGACQVKVSTSLAETTPLAVGVSSTGNSGFTRLTSLRLNFDFANALSPAALTVRTFHMCFLASAKFNASPGSKWQAYSSQLLAGTSNSIVVSLSVESMISSTKCVKAEAALSTSGACHSKTSVSLMSSIAFLIGAKAMGRAGLTASLDSVSSVRELQLALALSVLALTCHVYWLLGSNVPTSSCTSQLAGKHISAAGSSA